MHCVLISLRSRQRANIYKRIKYTYNSIRISISIICDLRTHRALTIISEDFGAWHATFVWVSGCKHKVQILLIMECAVCLCSPFPCAILGRSFVLWCTFSPASDFSIYSLRYFYYICLTCPSLYANRYADAATNPTRRCCCIGGADSGGDWKPVTTCWIKTRKKNRTSRRIDAMVDSPASIVLLHALHTNQYFLSISPPLLFAICYSCIMRYNIIASIGLIFQFRLHNKMNEWTCILSLQFFYN